MKELTVKIGDTDYSKGEKGAILQLVEYGDYECPFSQLGYRLALILMRNTNFSIRFTIRNFPLKKHPNAQLSAEAALAAGSQGLFWEMHDLLFDNYQNLNKSRLTGLANDVGLDIKLFSEDLDQRKF